MQGLLKWWAVARSWGTCKNIQNATVCPRYTEANARHLLLHSYVTARLVVTHRKLSFDNPSLLQFLLMATDGLWDVLMNAKFFLVGGHLAGLKGSVPKDNSTNLVPSSIV
ncbi:hypothetical protein GYMLUDRAFT_98852, partial [Collybiopsis luxurians FD-317 M1]